jgi:hypothetical protein
MRSDSGVSTPTGTNRRTFLAAGGAVVAGSLLLRGELGTTNGGLATLAGAAGPRIGVGYVEGSQGATTLAGALMAGSKRIVPAASLAPGGLSNQAVSMVAHGFTPGTTPDSTCTYSNVFLDAHIASPDRQGADATIPFYAWTFRRSPAPMASGQSRFVIGSSRGLRIGFSLVASDATPSTAVFTSGSERALPKLQEGVYLLGLAPGAWQSACAAPNVDDPAWGDLASMIVTVHAV